MEYQPDHAIQINQFVYGIQYRIPLVQNANDNEILKKLRIFPEIKYDSDRKMLILVNHKNSVGRHLTIIKPSCYKEKYNAYKTFLMGSGSIKNGVVPILDESKLYLTSNEFTLLREVTNHFKKYLLSPNPQGLWVEYFENCELMSNTVTDITTNGEDAELPIWKKIVYTIINLIYFLKLK